MYTSLKIVRKLSYAWMYYPNGLTTGFAISKGYITGDEVTGLLQIVEQGKTKRPEVFLTDVIVEDEYAGGGEISFTNFYDLQQYLVLLNNPLVVELVGGDFDGSNDNNKFVLKPGFSILGNIIMVNANGVWKIGGVTYTNPVAIPKTIQLCQPGKFRLEYIIPNNLNGFDTISGLESESLPLAPQIPYDNLYVTFYLVSDESIENPQEPINSSEFVQKIESHNFNLNYNGDAILQQALLIDNRSSLIISNGITEIHSLSMLQQFMRPGKVVYIKNASGSSTLLKGISGSGNVKFDRDYIVANNDTLFFKLNTIGAQNGILEIVGCNSIEKLNTGNYIGTAENLNTRIDSIQFPDEVLVRGIITKVGNLISILTGEFKARINQIEVINVDDYLDEINLTSIGFIRTDIVVLDANGNFIRIEGDEAISIAEKPQILPYTVEITSFDISDSVVSGPLVSDNSKLDRGGYNGDALILSKQSKIYENGERQIFRQPGTVPNQNNFGANVGDFCVGFVEGQFINADYIGGDENLLTSYNI